jgi:hypothetical protein
MILSAPVRASRLVVKVITLMKIKTVLFLALLSLGVSGCSHQDWFSSLDHCYLADWTNHHSYLSCCCDGRGNCQHCQSNDCQ